MSFHSKTLDKDISEQVQYNFLRSPFYFGQRTQQQLHIILKSLHMSLHQDDLSAKRRDEFERLLLITQMEINFGNQSKPKKTGMISSGLSDGKDRFQGLGHRIVNFLTSFKSPTSGHHNKMQQETQQLLSNHKYPSN